MIISQIEIYYDYKLICDYTGSQKSYRQWGFGLVTNETYEESELENFLKKKHPDILEYYWESWAGGGDNLFGQTVSIGHGRPRNLHLCLSMKKFNKIVAFLSAHEKLELYHLLRKRDRDLTDKYYFKIREKMYTKP